MLCIIRWEGAGQQLSSPQHISLQDAYDVGVWKAVPVHTPVHGRRRVTIAEGLQNLQYTVKGLSTVRIALSDVVGLVTP